MRKSNVQKKGEIAPHRLLGEYTGHLKRIFAALLCVLRMECFSREPPVGTVEQRNPARFSSGSTSFFFLSPGADHVHSIIGGQQHESGDSQQVSKDRLSASQFFCGRSMVITARARPAVPSSTRESPTLRATTGAHALTNGIVKDPRSRAPQKTRTSARSESKPIVDRFQGSALPTPLPAHCCRDTTSELQYTPLFPHKLAPRLQ